MASPIDFSFKNIQLFVYVIVALLIMFKPQVIKPYCTQIILVLILLCLCSSDTVEGAENDDAENEENNDNGNNDNNVKTFYAYFGRESAEQDKNRDPPYYVPENIDFADLKGELAFFKNEFLPDSQPYGYNSDPFKDGRKYGISFIDKWVFKYKGDFGSFSSFQDQAVGPCVDDATPPSPVYPCPTDNPLVTQLMSDYNDGKYLGIQPAMGGGYYISSIGKCPNLNSDDKSSDDCLTDKNEAKYSNKINVVNIDKFKTTYPDDNKPIVASYVGSVSLNDIVNHAPLTACNEKVVNAYKKSTKIQYPSRPPDKDSGSLIFSNFLNNPTIEDSDIFKLLSNSDIFNCKIESPGKYSIATPPDLGEIGTIDSKKTPSKPDIAACTPGDNSQCQPNYYHCSDGGGCQSTPWTDCGDSNIGKQCKQGVSLYFNYP